MEDKSMRLFSNIVSTVMRKKKNYQSGNKEKSRVKKVNKERMMLII